MYHVYDWRELPLRTAAALAAGLPDDSRVRRRMYGVKDYPTILMLAEIIDLLRWLQWSNTTDGVNNRNRPASMRAFLLEPEEQTSKKRGFDSIEAFDEAYKRFIGN